MRIPAATFAGRAAQALFAYLRAHGKCRASSGRLGLLDTGPRDKEVTPALPGGKRSILESERRPAGGESTGAYLADLRREIAR